MPESLHGSLRGAALLASFVLMAGCNAASSSGELAPPPAEVQASFTRFTDSIIPRLQDSLFSAGFRHHDPAATAESNAPVALRATVSAASSADAKADVFEGVIEGAMQRTGDATTHWPVSLHFGRVPGTSRWMLLTSAGYPDDGQPRTPVSAPRMPPLALASIMPQLKDVQEWQAWWEQTEKRSAKK